MQYLPGFWPWTPKLPPRGYLIWYQYDVPLWHQNGTSYDANWYQNGMKLTLKWYFDGAQNGNNMASKWY